MSNSNIEDYLEKGMYGVKQTKPEERRKFLGTLRERIVVALTKAQVMEKGIYIEVKQLMQEHPQATLLLNGDLDYSYLSDYIVCARTLNIPFSIVASNIENTDIGLVLTYDHAIDKKEIYISKENTTVQTGPQKEKKGVFSSIAKFLKR